MIKQFVAFGLFCFAVGQQAFSEVLIVADEFPAMQVVASKLKAEEKIDSRLVWQTNLPPSLAPFQAVIVYIHKDLSPKAEQAFIEYAKAGGRLVLLHHSISSGKRKNRQWFPFLGVALPEGDVNQGGYKWIEGVSFDLADLAPNHFIMSNKVNYPAQIAYVSPNENADEKKLAGFHLDETEVYLNHELIGPRTLLMGFKFTDSQSGKTYRQQHAGWVKPAGKGWIVYLMPGHTKRDFENPTYGRIVLNAVVWKP